MNPPSLCPSLQQRIEQECRDVTLPPPGEERARALRRLIPGIRRLIESDCDCHTSRGITDEQWVHVITSTLCKPGLTLV